MKKNSCILLVVFLLTVVTCAPRIVLSNEEKTELTSQKEKIVFLVNEAVNLVEEKGESIFPEFRQKSSKWFHDDFYIFIWRTDGIRVVYPPDISGESKDMSDLKDFNGKPIGRMFIDIAKSRVGEGWIDYEWPKPDETKPSIKYTFIKKAAYSNQTYLVGSGFYIGNYIFIRDIKECEYVRSLGASICEFFHPKRTDKELAVDYSIAYVILEPGEKVQSHRMKNAEVYYILEGEGILYIDEVPIKMHQGQIIYIPSNSKQFIENTSLFALKYFAINQPAWSKENEEIVD